MSCSVSERDGQPESRRPAGIAVSPAPASFAPLLFAGDLEEAARTAAKVGLDCLELSVRDPSSLDPAAIRELLDGAGLFCTAVATGQACLSDGLCLAAADQSTRAAATDRFAAQVSLASELDAAVILGGVRGVLAARQDGAQARRRAALDAIRACVSSAAEREVTVLLEPINRYETDFVNSCHEGLELLDEIGAPGTALLLDTFHMNIEERELAEAIVAAGDRLGYVHMVDSNRYAPGLGHVDFEAVFAALEQIAYAGPLVAEILPHPTDHEAAVAAASFFDRPRRREPAEPVRDPTGAR
jgi:5-keto-L-gluconate epimerase